MKSDKLSTFGQRLLEAFGDDVPKGKIAEVLGVKASAVSNYLQDRIPDADKLQAVSDFTNCSIHWLITGEGEKFLNSEKKVNLDDTFREIVRDMIREEIESVEKNRAEIRGENIKNEKEKALKPMLSQKK